MRFTRITCGTHCTMHIRTCSPHLHISVTAERFAIKFDALLPDLHTIHAKSINWVIGKCGNVLIQSPWIGITWIHLSIQSCYLVHINRLKSKEWLKWFNQINQWTQYICWPFFGKHSISLTFFWKTYDFVDLFWIFWINSIIPIPQSQSTQSHTLWKRNDSVTNQLTWKRNRINSINFAEKINRFKSIDSVEWLGIQVWLLHTHLVCVLYRSFVENICTSESVPVHKDVSKRGGHGAAPPWAGKSNQIK